MPRILFVSEAVTLAHVARPMVLAGSLDSSRYEICFACDTRYDALFSMDGIERRTLYSISTERFQAALAKGRAIYTANTLKRYVDDDLELIRHWSPDLIVGDFRISLSVSARVAGIPYLSITNAYWSPYARQYYPIPEHFMARLLGVNAAQAVFTLVRPLVFATHTMPLNRVRKMWGQPSLGSDLRRVYTDADHTLYADVPGFIFTPGLPDNHHFLGPILWSPVQDYPAWWHRVRKDRPIVYVTPGSSGHDRLMCNVVNALASMPVEVIVATAGKPIGASIPENVYVADFLPGVEAAERADLVICNGGSPTTQQALATGTPVLGICSNLDQYLNMQAVEMAGAGCLLRAGKAVKAVIRGMVRQLLEEPAYRDAAKRMMRSYKGHDAQALFGAIVNRILT